MQQTHTDGICDIDCNGGHVCEDAAITWPTDISCYGDSACEDTTIICAEGKQLIYVFWNDNIIAILSYI